MKEIILSAIIIAKNAEETLKQCLDSIKFCDEIILVDNGSTDKTINIAKSFDPKIVKGIANNFAENRNIGLHQAKGKWVLYVDTDERISPELATNIQKAITSDTYVAYKLQRKNFYLGKHQWPKVEQLERLFLRSSLKEWHGKLHETPRFNGPIGLLEGYVMHFTHRNLESMLDKTLTWSKIEAQLRLDSNHPKIVWWRLLRVMITGFWNSYVEQGGWKAGTMGFIESIYQSYSMFITYASLWEMQQRKS